MQILESHTWIDLNIKKTGDMTVWVLEVSVKALDYILSAVKNPWKPLSGIWHDLVYNLKNYLQFYLENGLNEVKVEAENTLLGNYVLTWKRLWSSGVKWRQWIWMKIFWLEIRFRILLMELSGCCKEEWRRPLVWFEFIRWWCQLQRRKSM